MNELKQLTPQEVVFVGGETAEVYQHTAGLIMMEKDIGAGIGWEEFRRHMEERLALIPQFHWKLHEVPLGLDLPYWVEDEHFSFDHHIRRIAVPSPGDDRALSELVSHLYCKHLDRARPLWELWYIEGLAGGKCALLQKMHHCMMDGEGASKLGETMWDFERRGAHVEVDPAIAEARPGRVPAPWQMSLNAARHLSALPMKISREIVDVIRHKVERQIGLKPDAPRKPGAPRTSFNTAIGSDRGFVFGSLPLADVKAIKSHFDVTVNDVVLALVGGSLRNYLLARGELPEESLRTSIAVSLRKPGDDDFSNHVTTAMVTLATSFDDPVQRLRAIAEESTAAKEEARHGGRGVLEIAQIFPPILINAMIRMTPPDQVTEMAGVNVVVSNVRGSPTPMYIAGARISAVYPMSIITPGGGINMTCFSYAGDYDFGCTVEPDLVPDPWRIIDGLKKSLAQYMALVGKRPVARKKPAARVKAGKAKRPAAKRKVAPKLPAAGRTKARPKRGSVASS